MLNSFRERVPRAEGCVQPNQIPYYLEWVTECYAFLNIPDSTPLSRAQRKRFLDDMGKRYEDWEVKEANIALIELNI